MRNWWAGTIALICVAFITGCGGGGTNVTQLSSPASSASGKTTISGTVYAPSGISASKQAGRTAQASATGKDTKVSSATVSLSRMKSGGSLESFGDAYSTTTDANGQFSIASVPTEENIVIVAQKTVTVNGNQKTLKLKKTLSVTEDDASNGSITGLDLDVSTTLTVEAMKDIITTANQGAAENNKIDSSDLPREMMEYIQGDIETALGSDQADANPTVDLASCVTSGDNEPDTQLENLENSSHGATAKQRKEKAATKGSVRVHVVVINDDGPPLQDATVYLTVDGQVQTGTTNDKGNAFFYDIEPGSSLDIEVKKAGYTMVKTSMNIERAAIVNNVTVHMTTGSSNQAPIAKAGPDQSVDQNALVTLDGSNSFDPDGDNITYAWTQTSGTTATLSSMTSSGPTFTPPAAGTYTFSLTVNDGNLDSEVDTVTITVLSVACLSDTDCDDGDVLTIDSCTNPGTSSAACENTTIACNTDTDCNDSDALTIDTCQNSGSINAVCVHEPQSYQILATGYNSCVFMSAGSLKCWGMNNSNQLNDDTITHSSNIPVDTLNISEAVTLDLGGGYYHFCALINGGSIKCWGTNSCGQLGNGTTVGDIFTQGINIPVDVVDITDATSISLGGYHSCALLSGGNVKCWGDNQYLQLGDGTTVNNSSIPVDVVNITNALQVSSGHGFTCALLSGGNIQCWGNNSAGQLGDGTTTDSNVPVDVLDITDAVGIFSGNGHACALLSGGNIKCWGGNGGGQLGNGTTLNSNFPPVDVLNITDAVEVTAGGAHTCALLSGGNIKCWGSNDFGELGDGTTTGSNVPVDVLDITDAVALASGIVHTCALLSGGNIKCWGRNVGGALGNGTYTASSVPVAVTGF